MLRSGTRGRELEEMQRKGVIGDLGGLRIFAWGVQEPVHYKCHCSQNSFNVSPQKALLQACSSFLASFSLSRLAGLKLVLWLTLKLLLSCTGQLL